MRSSVQTGASADRLRAPLRPGFNVTESVNLAPPDWLRAGAASQARHQRHRRQALFSHERLVLKVIPPSGAL